MILNPSSKILVCGAGGFIGGHLTGELRRRGCERVRAVDLKPTDQWYQFFGDTDARVLDLRRKEACEEAIAGCDVVFNLAADMGGMGFISANKADCMVSVLINTHLLQAAIRHGVQRYFYASSACVYDVGRQTDIGGPGLRERDAYPAMPMDGYGWEKLFGERMCRHFREDFGLETRMARFHNTYGPSGAFEGGREKAPAAICRKVIDAKLSGRNEIEIWGDGEQSRSFTYISDCVRGIWDLTFSDVSQPLNLGIDRLVSINRLVDMVEAIAEIKLRRRHVLDAPQGVRGRNSDNTLFREQIGWVPEFSLEEGMAQTYAWIYDQVRSRYI